MMYYILENCVPVHIVDIVEWSNWFRTADRNVDRYTDVGVEVITSFLGIDHNFSGKGPPILFETMVFGGEWDQTTWRCSTWDYAKVLHNKAVSLIKGVVGKEEAIREIPNIRMICL